MHCVSAAIHFYGSRPDKTLISSRAKTFHPGALQKLKKATNSRRHFYLYQYGFFLGTVI
jgi:hypothetical protein